MTLGSLCIEAQGGGPALLENLCGMSCSGTYWLLGGAWFQCRYGGFSPGEKHQQMTWTVLPQGFRDSPHLFGQALSRDLLDLDLGPNGKMLQKETESQRPLRQH